MAMGSEIFVPASMLSAGFVRAPCKGDVKANRVKRLLGAFLLLFGTLMVFAKLAEAAPQGTTAALRGDRVAIREVAKALVKKGPRHFPEAARLRPRLRSEALQGSSAAAEAYGMFLQYGIGGQARPGEAVTWYRRSANEGDTTAAEHAALALALGWGVRRDGKAARRLLSKLNPERRARAMLRIGEALLAPGREEPAVATRWITAAAALGTPAAVKAADLYERIEHPGTTEKVLEWLRPAAKAGNPDAAYALARRLAVAEDPTVRAEAADLYLISAEAGNERAASALLALVGSRADAVDDPVLALLSERAEAGSSAARFILGETYMFRSVYDNTAHEKARSYLTLAARDGITDAQYEIGMLELADGDKAREHLARAYLSLAAQAGHPLAQQAVKHIGEISARDAQAIIHVRLPRPRPNRSGREIDSPSASFEG